MKLILLIALVVGITSCWYKGVRETSVGIMSVGEMGVTGMIPSIFNKTPFDAIKNQFVKNMDQYIQSININQEIRDQTITLSSTDSFEKIEIMLKNKNFLFYGFII